MILPSNKKLEHFKNVILHSSVLGQSHVEQLSQESINEEWEKMVFPHFIQKDEVERGKLWLNVLYMKTTDLVLNV